MKKKQDKVELSIHCLQKNSKKGYWISVGIGASHVNLIKLPKLVAKWAFNHITTYLDTEPKLEKGYTLTITPFDTEHCNRGWVQTYYWNGGK